MAETLDSPTMLAGIATPRQTATQRLLALDIVRGYAMLLMLVSHTSWWIPDLEYGVAYGWDNMIAPTLRGPESALGFVLQLATPAFFLLAGFSIALFAASRRRRGWSEWQITRFLLIRGLVLIALDFTVMNLSFSPPYYAQRLSVLTGIGICVALMALLRRLDRWLLLLVALLLLLGTQAYYLSLSWAGEWPRVPSMLRSVLLAPSVEDLSWKSQFPALPWLPVVILGLWAASRVIAGASLGKLALRLGLGSLGIFALAMLANSVTSFYPDNPLVFGKHPPELAYISLYVGITFLLIALHSGLDRLNESPIFRGVALLGQTALFFYLIHIRLIEIVSPLIAPLEQTPLLRSLLIALVLLPPLLLLCAIYRRYKRQHPRSLLQYL